jgi:hypothetical protein
LDRKLKPDPDGPYYILKRQGEELPT